MSRNIIHIIAIVLCGQTIIAQSDYIDKAISFIGNNFDSAYFYSQKHNDWARQTKDIDQLKKGLILQFGVFVNHGNLKGAKEYTKKVYNEAKDKKSKRLLATYYYINAVLAKEEQNYSQSLRSGFIAYDIFDAEGDKDGLFRTCMHLIETNRIIGKHNDAVPYLSKAIELADNGAIDNLRLLAFFYNRLAAFYNETSKHIESIKYSHKSIQLNKKNNYGHHLGLSYNELGFSYKNLGNIDSAEYYYKLAETTFDSIHRNEEALDALNNRAMLYIHNGINEKAARNLYLKIIDKTQKEQLAFDLDNAYKYLSEDAEKNKNYETALNYLKLYHKAFTEKEVRLKQVSIDEIKEKYESTKNKQKARDLSVKVEQKNNENLIITIALGIVIILLFFVFFLLRKTKRINRALGIKSREKEFLVQEVHHRVKNNLQLIAAMMKMQLNTIGDDTKKEHLQETSRRINAMSLVHEMLYSKDASEYIILKDYLFELTEILKELITNKNIPIEIELNLNPEIKFNIANSVAIGMITSEIISNAIKHAFKGKTDPKITISFYYTSDKKNAIYQIKDNGAGMDYQNRKEGLGTRLIDIFARQIEAEYIIRNDNGLEYEFRITLTQNDL